MHQRWGTLNPDRFAAIGDIHGNRWGLTAVLEDADRRGITSAVNLGDHLWGPLDPEGTAELLMPIGMPSVRGNQDRDPQDVSAPVRAWLRDLPPRVDFPGITLLHGSPRSDEEYLLDTVHAGRVSVATEAEISERLGAEPGAELLLCGHTHVPRVVKVGGQLVVNPGSVGLQAYAEDDHVMETGSPHARYAVVERDGEGWRVEQIQLRYDWESAAAAAERNGRPDWAFRLRTGRAR
jgi:putative phosphoesterase